MEQKSEIEIIKDMLKKFTDDFSSVDVEFIEGLDYPCTIELISVGEDEEENISSRTVENLAELAEIFKKIPVGVDYTVKIPSYNGKMTLESRGGE